MNALEQKRLRYVLDEAKFWLLRPLRLGWKLVDNSEAPTSYEEVCEVMEKLGIVDGQPKQIPVSNLGLHGSIWDCARTHWTDQPNAEFRAIHDYLHWKLGADFSLDGEKAVSDAFLRYVPVEWEHTRRLILADGYLQAVYSDHSGEFVEHQMKFAEDHAGLLAQYSVEEVLAYIRNTLDAGYRFGEDGWK